MLAGASHSAQAQRGGGGGRRGGSDRESGKRSSAPEIPAATEIDKLDPIAMLVSNQKDLELSPETLGKLSEIDSDLMRGTKASLAVVDSLRSTIKAAAESPDSRGAVRESMNAYNRTVADIRSQHADAGKKALELLSGEPRKKAEKMLEERRTDFDKVTKTRPTDM